MTLSTPLRTKLPLDLARIEAARERAEGTLYERTPLVRMPGLERALQCEVPVHLKLETLQSVGSFKIRGAAAKMLSLPKEVLAPGVVAASAGNHSQGVAIAARHLGIPARIVMPENAPARKVRRTREYGAEVILRGANYDEAQEFAYALRDLKGGTFIHAFDDWDVMAGQGTIGLEILEDLPEATTVLCPVGGGGLVSGVAAAIKATRPDIRVIGVQSSVAASACTSFRRGKRTSLAPGSTIADGIKVGLVGARCFDVINAYVDEMHAVNDDELCAAMLAIEEEANLVAEPAAAAPLAALLAGKLDLGAGPIVTVLTGANVDIGRRLRCLRRTLDASRRFATDQPLIGP
jgi:threonine dehydratase